MRRTWNRECLMRRIDRCYLIASWTRDAVKRVTYLSLARTYRNMLAGMVPVAPPRAAAA